MNAQRYALLLHKWRYSLDVTTHAGHLDKVKYLAGERNAYIELRKEMILPHLMCPPACIASLRREARRLIRVTWSAVNGERTHSLAHDDTVLCAALCTFFHAQFTLIELPANPSARVDCGKWLCSRRQTDREHQGN
jgi:hypothetical protein